MTYCSEIQRTPRSGISQRWMHQPQKLGMQTHYYRKVICLQACVCPQGAAWSRGCMVPGVHGPGGARSQGVHGPRGGIWSQEGGCLVETPSPDGHCCGRYASYWNAFLFWHFFLKTARNWKKIRSTRGLAFPSPP